MTEAEKLADELVDKVRDLMADPPKADPYAEDAEEPTEMVPCVWWPKKWLVETIEKAQKAEAVRAQPFKDAIKVALCGLGSDKTDADRKEALRQIGELMRPKGTPKE